MNGAEVTFVGNITKEIDLRVGPSGNEWATFSVAVNERSRSRDGEMQESTIFFSCKAFGELAGNIAASVKKGDRVVVNGRMRTDSWKDSEGADQRRDVLYVDELALSLRWARGSVNRSGRSGGSNRAVSAPPPDDIDNPFA